MSAFAGLIVLSMGIMVATGITVAAFARSRQRPELYLFAGVCACGAVYALVTAVLLRTDAPLWLSVLSAQFGYVCGATYIALNVVFLSRYTRMVLAPWERAFGIALPLLIALSALVPGLCLRTDRVREYDVFGVPHLSSIPTPFGYVAVLALGVALLTMLRVAFRLRRSFFQRAPMIGSLALLVAFGISDMLLTMSLTDLPYLASVAGVFVSLAMAAHLASEWGAEAHQLVGLRRSLERGLERRSEALQDAQSRLAHKDRLEVLGRVAASVGHEVNNPLTYVIANLEVLRASGMDSETQELVDESLDGAKRIARIVRELRAFADTSFVITSVSLKSTAETAARTLAHRLAPKHAIDIRIAANLHVAADETQLTQIFTNILANALDSFAKDEEHFVRVTATEDQGAVSVRIVNNGAPIPAEHHDQLFQPFASTKESGLGLGLSIVRDMVRAFGGDIALDDSELTTFVLQLRQRQPELAESSREGSSLEGLRILLVEDQPEVARALDRMLAPAEVTRALNGFAALEALGSERFDVVLCDVMMPELSGLDLHRRLRERGPLGFDFIFMTGGAPDAAVQTALDKTGAPLLYKPFEPQDIIAIVRPPDVAEARDDGFAIVRALPSVRDVPDAS